MRLNELYLAHQGEGPNLGASSVFIRLQHCPVGCAWCDSAFTWDKSEQGTRSTPQEIAEQALALRAEQAVVTGGEPLVHKDLPLLLRALIDGGLPVEVETSAILPQPIALDGVVWNLSPKLPSAKAKITPDPALLRRWLLDPAARLKLVVADEGDWVAMEGLLEAIGLPLAGRVWLMPCATTREQLAKAQGWLLERAAGSPYRVTTRMHVLAYGEERCR